MMKNLFVFLGICFVFIACSGNGSTERIVIASEQADCIGVGPQKCFLIKFEGSNDWEFLYSGISGFNYEPGYEYVIEIKKEKVANPAADQSSINYIFVKEISKSRKTSEDLPKAS